MLYAPLLITICGLGYLIGSVPFGLIAGRLAGIDIRRHGSGNIGATNVWRVLGKKWGLPVFLLDVGKGLVAAVLGKWLALNWGIAVPLPHLHTEIVHLDTSLGGIAASMAVILGHNFPIWLKFKGGKGVATSLGVLFGLMPVASTIGFAVWGAALKITRYVSAASIISALCMPLIVLALFLVPLPVGMRGWAYFYFVTVAAIILILRHVGNIKRLLAGTERRIGDPNDAETTAELAEVAAGAKFGTSPEPKGDVIDAEIVPPSSDPRAD